MIGKFLAIKATRPGEKCWMTTFSESVNHLSLCCLFDNIDEATEAVRQHREIDIDLDDHWVYEIVEIHCCEHVLTEV